MELLKKQQAAGKRYEWNITQPDVHISLQKQGRIWKIVFMHSTRVPTLSHETHGR